MAIHKRSLAGIAMSATALSLAGCSSATPNAGASETIEITMVQGVTSAPFAQTTARGAKAAADEIGGVKFDVAGPANIDPAAETKIFQQVAGKRPAGILVQELPPDLFTRLVKDAEDSGIKVLPYTIAPAVNSTSTTFVGDNGKNLGRLAANRMADELVKTKGADVSGEVVTGICVPGLSVLQLRIDGFKEQMSKRLPKVNVLDPFDSKTDKSQDFTVWQQATAAHPDALAMFSPCEFDNQNLVKIKRSANAKWLLTPMDLNDEVISGIKDGTVLAIFPQSSYLHGYISTRILAESLKNKTDLPRGWGDIPVVPVDAANVEEIIKRESSAENQASYWKPYIDKIFSGNPVSRPLEDATK